MQLGLILGSLALWSLAGCSHAVQLQDRFQISEYRLPFKERLHIEAKAPIIVFGRVNSVTNIGGPKQSPGDPRVKTQLTTIGIDVLQTIKGKLNDSRLKFYFFAYSQENQVDLGVPTYTPEVGQDRIFFLEAWQGVFRSIGDVTNYNLKVRSGARGGRPCRETAAGCCVAELLLVPSDGIDVDRFVQELGPTLFAAGVLCSPQKAQDFLKQLMQHPDSRLSGAALAVHPSLEQWWPQLKQGNH
jgi:hypothetical protein